MAVTLTVAKLAAAIRIGDSVEETAEVTRLLAFATEAVTKHAPDAPDAAHDEAAIRLAAYLYDQPNAGAGIGYAHAGRNSGAWALLLPYRVHRAGSTGEAVQAAQEAVGTASNPVTDVRVSGADMVISFADGTTRTETLPAAMTGGAGVDQTARAAAAAAQSTANDASTAASAAQGAADAAQTTADAARTAAANAQATADTAHSATRDQVIDVENGRLPGPPVAMRLGWSQTRTFTALDFNRPPLGGSASGMSDGLAVPAFPPALASDRTLYLGIWLAGDPDVAELPSGFPAAGKQALPVDGAAGHYYPSSSRLAASVAGTVYRVVTAGPRILTTNDLVGLGGGDGLGITSLGSYTTTAQAMSGDVQDTGIASPNTGQFLIITIGGEEDVIWISREFVHDHSGVPIPGGAQNNSVFITSLRAMRLGKTAGGNYALTNAFASSTSLIQAGVVLTFATIG